MPGRRKIAFVFAGPVHSISRAVETHFFSLSLFFSHSSLLFLLRSLKRWWVREWGSVWVNPACFSVTTHQPNWHRRGCAVCNTASSSSGAIHHTQAPWSAHALLPVDFTFLIPEQALRRQSQGVRVVCCCISDSGLGDLAGHSTVLLGPGTVVSLWFGCHFPMKRVENMHPVRSGTSQRWVLAIRKPEKSAGSFIHVCFYSQENNSRGKKVHLMDGAGRSGYKYRLWSQTAWVWIVQFQVSYLISLSLSFLISIKGTYFIGLWGLNDNLIKWVVKHFDVNERREVLRVYQITH